MSKFKVGDKVILNSFVATARHFREKVKDIRDSPMVDGYSIGETVTISNLWSSSDPTVGIEEFEHVIHDDDLVLVVEEEGLTITKTKKAWRSIPNESLFLTRSDVCVKFNETNAFNLTKCKTERVPTSSRYVLTGLSYSDIGKGITELIKENS